MTTRMTENEKNDAYAFTLVISHAFPAEGAH